MLHSNSRQLMAACLEATIAMSTPAFAGGKNLVAGTWLMVSAKADPDGENRDLFSSNPSDLLIFTEDLHFSDVLVNPDIPSFASSGQAIGTAAENEAAGDLALGSGPRAGPGPRRSGGLPYGKAARTACAR